MNFILENYLGQPFRSEREGSEAPSWAEKQTGTMAGGMEDRQDPFGDSIQTLTPIMVLTLPFPLPNPHRVKLESISIPSSGRETTEIRQCDDLMA